MSGKIKVLFVFLNLFFVAVGNANNYEEIIKKLDVSKTCDLASEKENVANVVNFFYQESWWNIGGLRARYTEDFEITHFSFLVGMAESDANAKDLGAENGVFKAANFVNGWVANSNVNAREYYTNSFEQMFCVGNRIMIYGEFSGIYVQRNDKGQVTHGVKYGSPINFVFEFKEVNGKSYIYRSTVAFANPNFANDAREALKKAMKKPAPTETCDKAKGYENSKLGLKIADNPHAIDKAIVVFPKGTVDDSGVELANPYKFDKMAQQDKEDKPLIECIDPSMTRTLEKTLFEFSQSMISSGFNPLTGLRR